MEAHIWYPWKVTDSQLLAIWWVLGTELGSSAREAVLLASEPSLIVYDVIQVSTVIISLTP